MKPETSFPSQPVMPHAIEMLLRLLFYSFLLGSCVLSLVALWSRAPRAIFAIFLAWTLSFYISVPVLSWFGKPQKSITTVIISRLRTPPVSSPPPETQHPPVPSDGVPFPTSPQGPYVHQPPYRAAISPGQDEISPGPRSVEADDDDEDEDEDTRQRRIEDEMSRRDVSIVTVPKRKLWIANPS